MTSNLEKSLNCCVEFTDFVTHLCQKKYVWIFVEIGFRCQWFRMQQLRGHPPSAGAKRKWAHTHESHQPDNFLIMFLAFTYFHVNDYFDIGMWCWMETRCSYASCACIYVSCSFSLSPFMYIDNSKMREFTFRLYFNRTSIYHNIIETLFVCFYQHTGATNTIWHIQSDLIGGASNRETNVKLQKQSSCQNWWFLSPSPVLSLHLFFPSMFLHYWHTTHERMDTGNSSQQPASREHANGRHFKHFACATKRKGYLYRSEMWRSFHSACSASVVLPRFGSISCTVLSIYTVLIPLTSCILHFSLSIIRGVFPFHFILAHSLRSPFIITIIEPNFKARTWTNICV